MNSCELISSAHVDACNLMRQNVYKFSATYCNQLYFLLRILRVISKSQIPIVIASSIFGG